MKRDFQNVRTTAYTHTEADHRQFTNHNALGGRLQAATGAIRRAEYTPRAVPVSADDDQSDYRRASYNPAAPSAIFIGAQANDKSGENQTREETGGRCHETADWQRGGRLVALAGRNGLPSSLHRAGLQGG